MSDSSRSVVFSTRHLLANKPKVPAILIGTTRREKIYGARHQHGGYATVISFSDIKLLLVFITL